ncbi:MAG: glutamate-1-semialdehyde 2,1-aminomutase [Candidatus Omnitrophota bacterium]
MVVTNKKLFQKAKHLLVGGVSSPVRAFNYVGGEPILIKKGQGVRIYDYDGKEYIDYVFSWGSLILGHAFPAVVRAVKKAADLGLSFGTTHAAEIELAVLIRKAIPAIEKIRFVNSGTEAVMGAVRLARAYTKRNKIVKFSHSYHGHADYLLVKGGSGLATFKLPASAGVPDAFVKDTLVVPFGDRAIIEKLFKRHGREIAAVLFEPVGGNYGVIAPDIDFLKYLRAITKRYGTLLIADEVITGFRFHFGSFTYASGIDTDLICLGKIIGGGLPVGAYAGRQEIMNQLAPLGKVYQASTFSGNPVVMQAGLATLKALVKLKMGYKRITQLTEYLAQKIEREAALLDIDLKVNRFGSLFNLRFKDRESFAKFYRGLLSLGVYFAPSEFEANFLSLAQTKKDIAKTIVQVKLALQRLRK